MQFSEKFKTQETAKRMSQTDLAEKAGISLRTFQNYELGVRTPKSHSTYNRIAEALEMNVNILLDENAELILWAGEKHSSCSKKQAMSIVNYIKAMWTSGEMDEESIDAIMQTLSEAHWGSKKVRRQKEVIQYPV